MTALVLLDYDATGIKQPSRSAVAAAAKLGEVHALIAGENVAATGQAAAKIAGVTKVLVADGPAYAHALAEPLAALIVSLAGDYSHVLAAATAVGKNVMPRAAALLDSQPISDISDVIDADTFVRPIYAGNALATVKSSDAKKFITVRAASFDAAPVEGGSASIETVTAAPAGEGSTYISSELSKSERPELTAAKIIVSGGRGMQNGENFTKLLDPIADKLGAAVGATRAAVEAGYIAIGISGAIQHLAGMKDSKVIVAINKDEDAPIFQVADYGLVGDLFTILPELDKAL
jgi:electron transfer flavoprotein alpha subunit